MYNKRKKKLIFGFIVPLILIITTVSIVIFSLNQTDNRYEDIANLSVRTSLMTGEKEDIWVQNDYVYDSLDASQRKNTTPAQGFLKNHQYIKHSYKIESLTDRKITYQISANTTEIVNYILTYSVNDGEELPFEGNVLGELVDKQVVNVQIFIRVDDINNAALLNTQMYITLNY